jgi:hypothetical protein
MRFVLIFGERGPQGRSVPLQPVLSAEAVSKLLVLRQRE